MAGESERPVAADGGRPVLESQNEALRLTLLGAPLAEVFCQLIAAVERAAAGGVVGSILMFDAVTNRLRLGAAPGLPEEVQREIDGTAAGADGGPWGAAALRNETVIVPDIAVAPGWRGYAERPLALGLVAAWSMPIVSTGGRVVGAFDIYARERRGPTDTETALVATLAQTAALAIERRAAEGRLLEAVADTARRTRLYEAVLSTTPDLVYVFDLSHRFTYANAALLAMWGRTAEEAIGKNCLELGYEPWHAAMHDREIEEVVATRRPIRGQVPFNGTNGRRFYDYIFVPVFGASGEVEAVAGTTRDITESRRAAAAVQFLADLAQTLAVIGDEREIIRRSVEAVGRHFGAHRCYFVECSEVENRIEVSENWVRDGARSLEGTLTLSDFGGHEWWQEFSRGDFAVEDATNHPLISATTGANYLVRGIRSYAVQPIKRAGHWTVVLAVTDDRPRQWTDDELRLLDNVAARVWPLVERARADAALRVARDDALAASRAKDDFLAALSHELRTPLNPVLLLASDAAGNRALPREVRADFETIVRNVTLEARLIDDLLDLTRIVHDKFSLDRKPLDVHALLRQTIETLRPDLQQKSLALTTRFDAPATAVVSGDDVRLQQIFWNLLKNAVKFTAAGGTIAISTRVPADKPETIAIDVTDTGIGLTAAEIARVFDPFTQGDHSETRGMSPSPYGGLGLGLAISQKIAELHGGTLIACSEGRDHGATFTLQVPLAVGAGPVPVARDATNPPMAAPAPSVAETERPFSVLLVEDHEPSRIALARLLANRKIEVMQAASAAEALAKAAERGFDLVISDIGLPDRDGYALMSELRERHGFRGIALSGYGMEADIRRSREAGFMAHLTKPVKIQALDQALRQARAGEL